MMATLVLGAIGTAVGGPIGGLIGTFLGAAADRAVFGAGAARSGARITDLAVQSSAYGEPIPRVYGRLRVAGNVIWSPGIRESTAHSGGGKHGGSAGSYSYSASFAVALSARAIAGIGRIWADGKLLRNADGSFVIPAAIRIHTGGEDQAADPLIVAAEGAAAAPAYRGLAYVVFEDLALAEFANRIPNLTFELIADNGDADVGAVVVDLCSTAGMAPPLRIGSFPTVHGFVAGAAGNIRSQLEPLALIADLAFHDNGAAVAVRAGAAPITVTLAVDDTGAVAAGEAAGVRAEDSRSAAATLPDALSIGFYDPARDYQLGLQRVVRRSPATRTDHSDLPVALDASAAKAVADRLVASAVASRTTAELHLPWRHAGCQVGATLIADGSRWRVRRATIEAMIVKLSVERLPSAAVHAATADAGRNLAFDDLANGPTVFEVLDLPPLPGPLPSTPRLWLALGGSAPGWRRASVEVSFDGGESYTVAGTATGATPIGVTLGVLPAGITDRWDRAASVDIELATAAAWLESRSAAAVLGGANLALVGDEIIQFARAEAIGPRRFRLSELLRGRRGTESSASGHAAAERFVLLDQSRLLAFDAPSDAIGAELRFRAIGRDDPPVTGVPRALILRATALLPLSPVHLRAAVAVNGDVTLAWVRRSRAGFGWIDAIDAPVAEAAEAWRIEIERDGALCRTGQSSVSHWTYAAADRVADGAAGAVRLTARITQASASAGFGTAASIAIAVPAV